MLPGLVGYICLSWKTSLIDSFGRYLSAYTFGREGIWVPSMISYIGEAISGAGTRPLLISFCPEVVLPVAHVRISVEEMVVP